MSPPVYLSVEEVEIMGKFILYMYIPKGSQVQKCRNKIFDRNEDGDLDITNNNSLISELYLRKQTNYSENEVFPYCRLNDLDENLINRARIMAVNQNPQHPWKDMNNLDILKSTKLYLKDYKSNKKGFTLACILLFGKDETIQGALPHHKTDLILRRINLDRYDDRDDVRTNLIDSFERIIAFGEKHLPSPFYLEDTQRIDIRNKIFREISSNILMHREFLSKFPAKVIIEKNRVYTENANIPYRHGKINLNNFSPLPKNPIIAKVFKEIGFADDLGSGTRNLMRYVKIYSGKIPELIEEDIFKVNIPLPPQVSDQVSDQVRILEFCKYPKKRNEIMNFLNLKHIPTFRKNYLRTLLENEFLRLTNPESPNSPQQKYITTKKGKEYLKKKQI